MGTKSEEAMELITEGQSPGAALCKLPAIE
jgi:hypothetical protein